MVKSSRFSGHEGDALHHAVFERGALQRLAVKDDLAAAGSTPISALSRWTCRRRWGR